MFDAREVLRSALPHGDGAKLKGNRPRYRRTATRSRGTSQTRKWPVWSSSESANGRTLKDQEIAQRVLRLKRGQECFSVSGLKDPVCAEGASGEGPAGSQV